MDRRVFIVGTVVGASACGGRDSSSTGSTGLASGLVPVQGAAAQVVPSGPAPRVDGRYRTDQAQLFIAPPPGVVKSADGSYWESPARESVAGPKSAYGYAGVGPSATHVDVASGWTWANRNGDWVDASGKAQGSVPHWSFAANAAAGDMASTYSVDMGAAARAVRERKTWNAYVVRGSGSARTLASNWHASPPLLEVSYADGTTAVLKCTAFVAMDASTSYAQGGSPEVYVADGRNAVIEFEPFTAAVRTATLKLTVLRHRSGPGTISGFLAAPPLNAEPLQSGLAAAFTKDEGIRKHADVIFAHAYNDGTKESDWIEQQNLNVFNTAFWSPHVFDPSAKKDTSRLPFIHQGRWTKTRGNARMVASSYGGEGFQPLTPGLGAIRVLIPGKDAADGAAVGYTGGFGCDLAMYLPDELCGWLDEIYIRYYLRMGVHPPEYLRDMKMFRTDQGARATYAVHAGKFGIGASHWTSYGGNNNIGGGNIGWTNRNGWMEYPADVGSGATRPGVHSWDMLGYDRHFGSMGGLGAALYPGYWYCLETRLKLNTVDTSTSPFLADPAKNLDDAELDVWLDGRKVLEMRNFSYRKLPLDYSGPERFDRKTKLGKTPLDRKLLVPIRQLGVTAITLNDYNGGVLPAGADRVKFYTAVVVSKKPIGPMAGL